MLITRTHSTFARPSVTPAELDRAKGDAERTLRQVCADGVVTAAEGALLDKKLDALAAAEAAARGLLGQDINYDFSFETRAPTLSLSALRLSPALPKAGADYLIRPGDSWTRLVAELLKDSAPFTPSPFKAAGLGAADVYGAILARNALSDGNAVGVGAMIRIPTVAEARAHVDAKAAARAAALTPGGSYRVRANESAFSLAAELAALHPEILGGLDARAPSTVAIVARAIIDANPQLPGFAVIADRSVVKLPDAGAVLRAPTPNPMPGRWYVVAPIDQGVSVLAARLMASDPSFAGTSLAQVQRAIVKLNQLGHAANPVLVVGARLLMPTAAEL